MSVSGAFHHFNTITKHRHKVIAHCFKAGIPWRGLMHDLSKYTPTEFCEGAKNWLGTRSPNEKARADKGYSVAWLHHQGRNRHHFEYWFDYHSQTHQRAPIKMPFIFVLEMFCDRVAASKIYQGKNYTDRHPLDYFLRAKATRVIHPETSDLLESWLVMLDEKGEKRLFVICVIFEKIAPNINVVFDETQRSDINPYWIFDMRILRAIFADRQAICPAGREDFHYIATAQCGNIAFVKQTYRTEQGEVSRLHYPM